MATNLSRPGSLFPSVLGVLFLLLLVWGGLFAFIHHDRTLVEENAYRQAENFSVAFEEHAHNIILNVDNSLRYLGQVYLQSRVSGRPLEQMPLDGYTPLKTFQFAIIGADGIMLYSNLAPATTRVDLSDREHFRVHLNTTEDRLFVSRPILGRVSGKWSLQFTRKITLPDGSFGGVLVLSVERREFEDFFQRVDLGQRGLIALFGMDGWMRARGARVPELVRDSAHEPLPLSRPYFGPDSPDQGRIHVAGYYDGVERMGAYRRVRNIPLVVSVQLARDEVFADHAARANRTVVIGIVLTAGAIIGLIVVSMLRRQRDDALREAADSEQRWRLAVDAVGDGVWDWYPQTGALYFSQQMGAIVGIPSEQLPRTVPEWLETIHPDDRDDVARDFQAFLDGAPRFHHEYRASCAEGTYKWVHDRAVVVSRTADNLPHRVIGLRSDISERRQLQEELTRQNAAMQRLQAALAAREIGVARHRLSEAQKVARLGIIERHPASGRWMACEHSQALLGLAVADSYSLDDILAKVRDDLRPGARDLLAGGDLSAINLELGIDQDGETRYLRAVGCAPATVDEHAFVTLQDISARRASEREHARLRDRMEEASRLESLGTLAGGIAHEINTPAQYVGDNLAFLENCVPKLLAVAEVAERHCVGSAEMRAALASTNLDFLSTEVPDAIAQGLEGVRRIAKIVQAVKEFCYPSSREPQPCDLTHMIESAVTVTRNAWKYSAEMSLDLDPALPAVHAIEGEINQVLINLIINAGQAIAEKKVTTLGRITIRTRHDGERVTIAVADDGIGIPAERHKRIFELFYTTKPPGQGTGQGLAISSAIVRRHGGAIAVDSRPGEGACFTVTLPLHGPIGDGARGR